MNYVYWLIVIPNARSVNHKSFTCVGGPRKTHTNRYNNSSPRYSVRTTMLFPIHYLKVSQVSKYEISITLLLILICRELNELNPTTKVIKISRKAIITHHSFRQKI